MNHSFVVCDERRGFADRLAGYVNKRHLCPYLMESFTDVGMLEEYGAKNRIEVLLIDEPLYSDSIERMNIGKVFLLVEERQNSLASDVDRLYKYSPIPEIIDAVMCDYAERNKNTMSTITGDRAKIIGAFTPDTNLGHSSYLLTLALKTAEKRRVFYLNIRSTYGFRKMLNKVSDSDMSDVMYCIKTGNSDPDDWPEDVIKHYGNLDYILPALPVTDLHCTEAKDWKKLLDALAQKGYEYIFLDIDESTSACFTFLECCDLIYSPYKDDFLCRNAFLEFEEVLVKTGFTSVINKIRKISPPMDSFTEISEDLFSELKRGKMGEYVREVLHEDK